MLQREAQSLRAIFASQRKALSLALEGAPLAEILNVLLRCLEEVSSPGLRASILLLDQNGVIQPCAAPSLPDEYSQSLSGLKPGPAVGSCGTAMYRREPVLVADIATDPLWYTGRELAARFGLRSCFSTPIFALSGEVLGSLAIYNDQVGNPSPEDQETVALITQMAAVMVERDRDAGEKKRIEADADRARHQLSEVFRQAPVAVCVMDGPDHQISFVNQAFYTIFPQGPGQPLGLSIREVATDPRTAAFVDVLDQVYRSGEAYVGTELPSLSALKPGETIYLNCTYQPKRNAEGAVEGIICVFSDVTEQVRVRHALERAKAEVDNERENFRNLFTQTPELVGILHGPALKFEFVNESYTRVLGEDPTGRALGEAQPESTAMIEVAERVFRTGVTAELREAGVEIRGRTRFFNLTFSARMDGDGVIDGVMVLGTEVSDQIAVRREIEDQQRWLENILDSLPTALMLMDPATGRIVFANAAADKYAITPIEVLDKFGHPLKPEEFPSARALAGEILQNEEFYFLSARGGHHVAAHSATLQAAHGHRRTALLLMQDISQIKAAQAAAEAASLAKSAFLANMSHEIRTPLGAIMGFLDLMKNPGASREDINSYIEVVSRNSDQLLRLIDDILDLSKVEAGKMYFEKIDFSLRELLADFSKLMAFKAAEKGIAYRLHLTSSVPERILGDPTRLRQILTNVVGNAIKFTEKGSVSLDVAFFDDELRMTVTDTGCGISAEQAQKLFRPFEQADSSTTRAFGGTGLGLVLSRRLANAMGGDFILRRSKLGGGSVFHASVKVDLPAETEMMPNGELREPSRESVLAPQSAVLTGMNILVVEDAVDNQALLRILLGRLGADVAIVGDGLEAVTKAREGDYDLVLMDVQMPVMDGHEATRRLRQANFSKPIVALTAHAMQEERDRCEASGFTDFLTKPIHHESLVQVLMKYRDADPAL